MKPHQREYWLKRFVERERRMLAYYTTHPIGKTRLDRPDGSFTMNAFILGYEAGRRAEKRRQSAQPKGGR